MNYITLQEDNKVGLRKTGPETVKISRNIDASKLRRSPQITPSQWNIEQNHQRKKKSYTAIEKQASNCDALSVCEGLKSCIQY